MSMVSEETGQLSEWATSCGESMELKAQCGVRPMPSGTPGGEKGRELMEQPTGLTASQAELLANVERLLPSLAEAALKEARKNAQRGLINKVYIDIELYDAAVAYVEQMRRRYAEGEASNDAGTLAARPRTRPNLSDGERERRRQRMRDYWSKKRAGARADA